ncbi:MAG: DNA primase [Anaerolineaceae bacterium]|nr:DNA primase [Anaerolineaceae bacterium]|tara:strand:- start:24674 stop:26587 length:1914 start_codon:yes stop_codon:yes gene_type:complete
MKATEEIKSRLDIIEIIGETVKLRRTGNAYTGFCPFHDNKNTPAFVVWPDTGSWKCFGACNEGGDVFSFLMKKEGWEFLEALQYLSHRTGVELEHQSPQQENERQERRRMHHLLTMVSEYYHKLLIDNEAADRARKLLLQRGLSEETWGIFRLGYALSSWDELRKFCLGQGYSDDDLVSVGLLVKKDNGRVYDRFRDRIMMPICLQQGQVVGFGARVVGSDDQPKFINSPQTTFFDKGSLLYGIDKAYMRIREERAAVLVEGYMDVIAAHQDGFTNVVSAMGTALTEKQLRLLKRYAPRVVLALDPDVAGDRATLRSLSVARQNLERESAPIFDPRGLLRDEGHLELDIRVATMPNEMDPDELIASDPESWRSLISKAPSIVDYVMNVFTTGRDLQDSKVKAEIIDDIVPIISDVSHPAERADYMQKLARVLRVDERMIHMGKKTGFGSRDNYNRAISDSNEPQKHLEVIDELENYLVVAFLRKPEVVARVDRALREAGSEVLSSRDFGITEYQRLFEIIKASINQAVTTPKEYIENNMDVGLHESWQELCYAGNELVLEDERRIQDVISSAIRLRSRNLRHWLIELQHLETGMRGQGDLEQAQNYQDLTLEYTRALRGLQSLLRDYSNPLSALGTN